VSLRRLTGSLRWWVLLIAVFFQGGLVGCQGFQPVSAVEFPSPALVGGDRPFLPIPLALALLGGSMVIAILALGGWLLGVRRKPLQSSRPWPEAVPLDVPQGAVLFRGQQIEQPLQDREKRLHSALEAARTGTWEWNIQTGEIVWSKNLEGLFGFSPGEFDGTCEMVAERLHPEDFERVQTAIRHAVETGENYAIEFRVVDPDGRIRWALCQGKVFDEQGKVFDDQGKIFDEQGKVFDEQGNIVSMLVLVQDVTARKQAERELQQAKDAAEAANRSKSVFLSTMSHELRTPLNVVLGFAQLMAKDTALSPENQEYVELIHKNANHLLGLINEVLKLSKIEAGKVPLELQPCNVFALLQQIDTSFRPQAQEKGVSFHLNVAAEVPPIVVLDSDTLQQVLRHLLDNALKFTPAGTVTLRVGLEDAAQPDLLQPPSPAAPIRLQFQVEDTGIGISPSDQSLIFDAFVQVAADQPGYGGKGLGLTLSRRLIQLMGGDIRVHSGVGQGSRFEFWIPVEGVKSRDPAIAPQPTSQPCPVSLTPDHLGVMPEDWVFDLYQVALSCDPRAVRAVIQQIPPGHDSLAIALEQWVHDFEFAKILQTAQLFLEGDSTPR